MKNQYSEFQEAKLNKLSKEINDHLESYLKSMIGVISDRLILFQSTRDFEQIKLIKEHTEEILETFGKGRS